MSLPGALRAFVLALLVAALALPLWRERDAVPRPATNPARGDAAALLAGSAPPFVVRDEGGAPTAAELELLAAAGERAPVYAALPERVRVVEASVTPDPRAGRAAAVSFRVRGAGADSVLVVLGQRAGAVDSTWVRLDDRGEGAGAFRVRPATAGWLEWSVAARWPSAGAGAGGRGAAAGAWVDSAGPPRVLVRAGFPGWESKFVVRALEESGARVVTSLSLGRGLAVDAGGGGAIIPARLAAFDAAIVLDGAPLADAERAALADWASRGGGVLLVGDRAAFGGFGLARAGGGGAVVSAQAIRWSLPPELAPLTADRVSGAAVPLGATVAGTSLGAATSQGGVLALRPLGRGRAAALALSETWRWRMEAGRVAEHREFWRALVDWLAAAPRSPLAIDVPRPFGAPGERAEVRVYDSRGAEAGAVPPLVLARPGGGADTLALVRDPASPTLLRAWFVPRREGVHTLAFAGNAPEAAFSTAAGDSSTNADGWARLATIAATSGGAMLPPDSLRATVDRLRAGLPSDSRGVSPWLIFALLLAAAGAEWAIRRLRGAR